VHGISSHGLYSSLLSVALIAQDLEYYTVNLHVRVPIKFRYIGVTNAIKNLITVNLRKPLASAEALYNKVSLQK